VSAYLNTCEHSDYVVAAFRGEPDPCGPHRQHHPGHHDSADMPAHATNNAPTAKRAPPAPSSQPDPGRTTAPPGISDPNVKTGLTET
jgi:hypothetical protein